MTSLSTRFFGQPRLTKPTFVAAFGVKFTEMLSLTGKGNLCSLSAIRGTLHLYNSNIWREALTVLKPRTRGWRLNSFRYPDGREIAKSHANLILSKPLPLNAPGGKMSAKCLAVLVALVAFAVSGWAQVNDVSVTVGRTFISTQTVQGTNLPLHFGSEEAVAFNYGRFLMRRHIFGLTAELPVAIVPTTDLTYHLGGVPTDIGSLFITPSARVNIFAGENV
jgi:hypothetical protein